jgi:hypothetical protein
LVPICFELGAQRRFGERIVAAPFPKRSSIVAFRRPNENGLIS